MSLGFEQAGFRIVSAVEADPVHAVVYKRNFPWTRVINTPIEKVTAEVLFAPEDYRQGQEIDVVFGGPPCQGFSLIGKRRADDPRNGLLEQFARVVRFLRPKYFVVENVEGLAIGYGLALVERFVRALESDGFHVVEPIRCLNAADYGVPQRRRRLFLLGYRKGVRPPSYPQPEGQRVTVGDALHDLPNVDAYDYLIRSDVFRGPLFSPHSDYARVARGILQDPEDRSLPRIPVVEQLTGCRRTMHSEAVRQRFAATPPGAMEPVSRFYRLALDDLSPTLRAGTDSAHGSFTAPRPIHPVWPRCITVREAARLHSFPDWFEFHSAKWHGFRQIGNAVPPLLARAIARVVRNALECHCDVTHTSSTAIG
ncbi:MAG: DNA cytosine methyltransferase [Firmicutes bacterium]|nr:DNA cytosine methyltransferase [Bacillota bacterium]